MNQSVNNADNLSSVIFVNERSEHFLDIKKIQISPWILFHKLIGNNKSL